MKKIQLKIFKEIKTRSKFCCVCDDVSNEMFDEKTMNVSFENGFVIGENMVNIIQKCLDEINDKKESNSNSIITKWGFLNEEEYINRWDLIYHDGYSMLKKGSRYAIHRHDIKSNYKKEVYLGTFIRVWVRT